MERAIEGFTFPGPADTLVHMSDPIRYCDLHIHSNCSDGALSPRQLVQRAKACGLSAIALADHDSVAGVEDALAAGAETGVAVIAAVEISAQHKHWQDVHLLGYAIQHRDGALLAKLHEFRKYREHRNVEILERVNQRLAKEQLETIPLTDVLAHTRDAVGRPHIALALMQRGYALSVEEAFQRYLIPCNVPKRYWPVEEAITEVHRLGGLAVLAHPTTITTDRSLLRQIILELAGMGLDGVEVYNNAGQEVEMDFLRRLADETGLLVSAGSDFHGIEEGLEMGRGRGGIRFSNALLAPLWKRLAEIHPQVLSL